MPLFETTISIDHQQVAALLLKHWNLKLGKIIKASQNHTFEAFNENQSKKYAARVTPDPKNTQIQRITDELAFVQYLASHKLNHICHPVHPQTDEKTSFLKEDSLIIVVFEWAHGVPLPFGEFRWMKDRKLIVSWGRFFGQLHKLSQKFSQEQPQIAKRIQNWDEVHCGILKGVKLDEADKSVIDSKEHYGVLHGDLNLSNIYYVEEEDHLSVFDTDQVQRGFYLWDLAQAIFTLVMLEEGGMPISGAPCEGANRKQYQAALLQGYQSEGFKVDLARLDRLVEIKKILYVRFAKRAFEEGNVPADMAPFLKYILQSLAPKCKEQ